VTVLVGTSVEDDSMVVVDLYVDSYHHLGARCDESPRGWARHSLSRFWESHASA
jgi:hypothetical protein